MYKDKKIQETVIFPPTKAGESSSVILRLVNNIGVGVEITEIILEDTEVIIDSITKNLTPMGEGTIILSWKPNENRMLPLKTKIRFRELIG